MLKYLIKGQNIETLEHEIIADQQIAFVTVRFAFDNNWKPLHKVVQFTQECDTFYRVLGTDGTSCLLPAELHPGAVKMSLFGYDQNATQTVRATTVVHTLHIRPSGFDGESGASVPPTPDLYQQLIQQIIALQGSHTHDNKSLLDSITAERMAVWDAGSDGESDIYATTNYVDNKLIQKADDYTNKIHQIDEDILTLKLYLESRDHTHKNFDILESITADCIARWNAGGSTELPDLSQFATNAALTYAINRIKQEFEAIEKIQGQRLDALESELSGLEDFLKTIVEVQ